MYKLLIFYSIDNDNDDDDHEYENDETTMMRNK
jgi:hypothetical protein